MKPGGDKILARAEHALARADAYLAAGADERAIERAYHAIFHTARVVLHEHGDSERAHARIRERLLAYDTPRHQALCAAVDHALSLRESGDAPLPDDASRWVALARDAFAETRSCVELDHRSATEGEQP